ncbi:2-C-methyl-D-erythritol 4-phosphate cytidylyltransferase [Anaerospora sp.]|jgi:2-C-methyl-D-erythritol 4-phosphate cytidylyltransferase/2-C-methyl-D-erythritol 2,4-cyclodiphosphate synthase|uniref:2-C-methyl-D-erythritol 4-phosphate cytidylyltransferase n=1 Tax=Anaerospora sp. TaxID=1960278 RepID=UPI002898BA4E|nr:2-C-methyl-D-erythritol 4-phosphate cytidylyltransferase [Anaerospora sp.]MDF2928746.1 2-C-methyl-D-erythritol 4-phosphate cytidylyltransferase [Anaerospora sp.]
MITAIIAAAGSGKRMGSEINKIFLTIHNVPIIARSAAAIAACPEVDELIIVGAASEIDKLAEVLRQYQPGKPWRIVAGASERQYSITNALQAVSQETKLILVHDAARPLIDPAVVKQVIDGARKHKAAVVAVPVKDTIKIIDNEKYVVETPPRQTLWSIQTPQGFDATLLREAYARALKDGFLGTDDAGLVERLGKKVKIVPGGYNNIKITSPEDLRIAEALLGERKDMRVGIGYDVHRLTEGRKLILGGIEIPYSHGLDGHSDADVLLHAIKDALLGAAALGDIGRHFPDTDLQYKGASSVMLLARVRELLAEKGYVVHNVDATIIAEKPKLAPYISQMNNTIAETLQITLDQVNVKATTTETLGFTGRREGIAAQAAVTIIDA